MEFHLASIGASGALGGCRVVDSGKCSPQLAQDLTGHLRTKWGQLGWLYLPLPPALGPVGLAWRRIGWAGLARLEAQGFVASALALLPGVDAEDDELSSMMLQVLVTTALKAAGREPAFDLCSVEERPVALRVTWKNEFVNHARRRDLRRIERAISAAFLSEVKAKVI